MKLSVVITCRDDRRIVETVRSIDADVETLIVLNGSPEGFEPWLRAQLGEDVRFEVLERPNRARSVEYGIQAASNAWVLLMDSDCVFAPGSVAAMAQAFECGDPREQVFKGSIVYEPGDTRIGAVLSKSRTQRNRRLSAYKPALAFSREIAARIGGRFFDPRLIWKSDSELDSRIRNAGIEMMAAERCVVHHAPLSLRSDLRSSFFYGVGGAIAANLELEVPAAERSLRDAWVRDGAAAAAYMSVANLVLRAGRVYAKLRLRSSSGKWLAKVSGN